MMTMGRAGGRLRPMLRLAWIAAVLAACAGRRAALGTLTPPRDRITDEAIAADVRLFRAWTDRLPRLEADTTPARAYQTAKARGWLAFAQEEYTDNDRTQVVGDALAQAQLLILAMERGDPHAGRATPLVTGTTRVRQDLWNEAERFKNDPGFRCATREVARLEIELLRAGHETTDGASCRAEPHLRAAEALSRDIDGRIRQCRPGPVIVVAPPAPRGGPARPARPADGDRDGVLDPDDLCPNTSPGVKVDAKGCPPLFVSGRESLVLRGVNFEEDKAILLPEALAILDVVAASLQANPEVRVEVAGHTDSRSPPEYNLWLSDARAAAVRAYLIERGVAADRLEARGYGITRPIATNATAEGRAQNRRVELVRLK